jgi:hypothetical protein
MAVAAINASPNSTLWLLENFLKKFPAVRPIAVSTGTQVMDANMFSTADSSLARTPCQSSAMVTGEHSTSNSLLANSLHLASSSRLCARRTSMITSESTRTAFNKITFSGACLAAVAGRIYPFQASPRDQPTIQQRPPWLCSLFPELYYTSLATFCE